MQVHISKNKTVLCTQFHLEKKGMYAITLALIFHKLLITLRAAQEIFYHMRNILGGGGGRESLYFPDRENLPAWTCVQTSNSQVATVHLHVQWEKV